MLEPFFTWLGSTPLSTGIRDSVWIYAFVQSFHLVSVTLLWGAVLIVDLRLLRVALTRQSVAQVSSDAYPWLIAGLLGMLVTGIPQLLSNATKEYFSPYFWVKMQALAVALIFTFTLRRKVATAQEGQVGTFTSVAVGLVSIALWLTVTISGRLIGLLS